MMKTNLTDTLTYVTGLGAGAVGVNSIPMVTQPLTNGNVIVAIIGLLTLIVQAIIMRLNKKQDMSKVDTTQQLLNLQRQITDLKEKTDVDDNHSKS